MTYEYLKKSATKIQVSLKSDKNKWYFSRRPIYISTLMIMSRLVLLRMRNVSDKIVEKIKKHNLYSVTLFENHAFYEIM